MKLLLKKIPSPSLLTNQHYVVIVFQLFVAAALLVGCNSDGGGGTGSPYVSPSASYSQQVVAYNVSNVPVATFKFSQLYPAGSVASSISLVITNASSSQSVSFGYNIESTLNSGSWNYQGVTSTIAPGGSLNVGTIASTDLRLDLSQIQVALLNVTYGGGSTSTALVGSWTDEGYFDCPPNNFLGIPETTGLLSFTIGANGATTVHIIYLNEATGIPTGQSDTINGTLSNTGSFTGSGTNADGTFSAIGQVTSTGPESNGTPQVSFTFTEIWGQSTASNVGPYSGIASLTSSQLRPTSNITQQLKRRF